MPVGRFAPSPTGRLHVGNLRTALVAWLAARVDGGAFLVRFEDLDTPSVRQEHYEGQLRDLAAIGLDWDPPIVRQSERQELYRAALARLVADDAVYPCFCSRREIREAVQAPNGPSGAGSTIGEGGAAGVGAGAGVGDSQPAGHGGHRYPGTCRHLSSVERSQRAETRPPALRLRADGLLRPVEDGIAGSFTFRLDDFVVRRNDGVPAYHLVVVVDDAAQGIELVVRADDLLESAARQAVLYERLGLVQPRHAHVPLVLGPDGNRLAKRHGAVDLGDRAGRGQRPDQVLGFLAASLGLCSAAEGDRGVVPADLLDRFELSRVSRQPLVLPESWLS